MWRRQQVADNVFDEERQEEALLCLTERRAPSKVARVDSTQKRGIRLERKSGVQNHSEI